jgi:hypothetical protein
MVPGGAIIQFLKCSLPQRETVSPEIYIFFKKKAPYFIEVLPEKGTKGPGECLSEGI